MSGNYKLLAAKYNVNVPSQMDFSKRVMIIEDQQELRMIIAHHLGKLSFQHVIQKGNGYEALEYIRDEGKVDLFICDMDMPVMGGIDFLGELQNDVDLDTAPFCLAMDNVSKEKIMLAVESGVDEILVKPFTFGDIGPKLKMAFRKYHVPTNPEKVYQLAKNALREKSYDLAKTIYTDLMEAAPKAARPAVGLARVAMAESRFDDAMKLLKTAEAKNPSFTHTYTEMAHLHCQESDFDAAIKMYNKAISLSPLNPVRYKDAADSMFKVKKFNEAATLLESAMKRELDFPELYHYLSRAKFALKEYGAAAKYIKMALNKDPENVIFLNQLGISLKEEGQGEEAQRVYNQIIKLDPANKAALYNKSILLNSSGRLADAVKLLERLLSKHPDFAAGKAKYEEYKKELDANAA